MCIYIYIHACKQIYRRLGGESNREVVSCRAHACAQFGRQARSGPEVSSAHLPFSLLPRGPSPSPLNPSGWNQAKSNEARSNQATPSGSNWFQKSNETKWSKNQIIEINRNHMKSIEIKWTQTKASDTKWNQLSQIQFSEADWNQLRQCEIKWHKWWSSEAKQTQPKSTEINWNHVRSNETNWKQMKPIEDKWVQMKSNQSAGNNMKSSDIKRKSSETNWDLASEPQANPGPLPPTKPPIQLQLAFYLYIYIYIHIKNHRKETYFIAEDPKSEHSRPHRRQTTSNVDLDRSLFCKNYRQVRAQKKYGQIWAPHWHRSRLSSTQWMVQRKTTRPGHTS